jgi:hypothetical protein
MVKRIRLLFTVCPITSSISSDSIMEDAGVKIWDSGGKGLTIDALTGAKLASVGFISDKQKNRRLQLHNPDESVGFDNTSKMYVYPLKYSD